MDSQFPIVDRCVKENIYININTTEKKNNDFIFRKLHSSNGTNLKLSGPQPNNSN